MGSRRPRSGALRSDEGASAVEFALIAPLFFALICSMIDFARAYNVQLTLTEAAREGVRPVALMQTADGNAAVQNALGPDGVTGATVVTTPCPVDALQQSPIPNASVTVTYSYSFITPGLGSLFQLASGGSSSSLGSGLALTGRAAMRCGG